MISYSRPKLSDLYTLSLSKLLENHTLHSGIYLQMYIAPYMAVPPAPARGLYAVSLLFPSLLTHISFFCLCNPT